MMHSIRIYLYALLLVIGSLINLQKAKRLFHLNQRDKKVAEEIFTTPKIVSQKVIRKTGSKLYIKGQENLPNEAALYVANHQGIFDILAFLGYLGKPVGFIAKKEIERIPIIRTWMNLIHCVFIDREDRRQSIKAIRQGTANLKAGHSMVIFPEGTRSHDGNLAPFKPGSLRLGMKANVPIIPVAIDGTHQILEDDPRKIKASTIAMIIGKPIYPNDYADKNSKELAVEVETTIDQLLNEYRKDVKLQEEE